MQKISIIVAIDELGGIGKDNALLCHLPADLKHFKKITMGKPIIMGRRTFESIGRPLPHRLNIIISQTLEARSDIHIVDSLHKALAMTASEPEVFIIGGARLFEEALSIAEYIYLTEIHHQFKADVFFPQIDPNAWKKIESVFHNKDEKNIYDMTFHVYENILKKCLTKGRDLKRIHTSATGHDD